MVLTQVPPEPPLTHAIMDKGYDSKHIRAQLLAHDLVLYQDRFCQLVYRL
jgi:hypothetical protein